jgi:ATPase family associated with various cellular activities (AAA)
MDDESTRFARSFQRFIEAMALSASNDAISPVRTLLDEHLGVDSSMIPVISDSFPAYDHVNVQVALTKFLEGDGRTHRLVGLTGHQRHFASFSDLLEMAHVMGVRIGAPDLVTLATGPDSSLACVQFGLFLIDDRGERVAILVRGASERGDQPGVSLEIVCPSDGHAAIVQEEIRSLMVEHNVFRNQVLAFGETSMGHRGVGMLTFFPRARMSDDELVLPDRVLASIERHVLGIAEARTRLRLSGQHVKRGLMLHGPPGTGKTHTIRYLISRAQDHTVIVLTGGALGWIRAAVGLARFLQPCIVVCEDVDLVAQERGSMPGYSNPVLFDMLNAIDGIEEDADVTFVLTTNRADLLEPALAARPGRVDLAMEIPLPDAGARRRLIELYGRGLHLQLEDLDAVVERTEGVTASFIKELLRKAAMIAAVEAPGDGRITVADAHVTQALDELLDEESALTRVLLGGRGDAEASRPGVDWLRSQT